MGMTFVPTQTPDGMKETPARNDPSNISPNASMMKLTSPQKREIKQKGRVEPPDDAPPPPTPTEKSIENSLPKWKEAPTTHPPIHPPPPPQLKSQKKQNQ